MYFFFFFFQAEDGIRDGTVTGVQTCALPISHLWAGVAVAASGVASGVFVVIANAWMNAPTGFELVNGQAVNVDPIAAMANAAAVSQTLHMTLAAYAATGFAVAGIHAFLLLKA